MKIKEEGEEENKVKEKGEERGTVVIRSDAETTTARRYVLLFSFFFFSPSSVLHLGSHAKGLFFFYSAFFATDLAHR